VAVMLADPGRDIARREALFRQRATAVVTVLPDTAALTALTVREAREKLQLASEEHDTLSAYVTDSAIAGVIGPRRWAVLKDDAQEPEFAPLELKLAVSIEASAERHEFASYNLVGRIVGSQPDSGAVLLLAHWDHLGRCTPAPDGDDICNGAVDNATGTAALVALAEAHAKAGPPRRSLVFLAVTAEESGLLGAKYYAENPVFPLAQTVGGVNMDALQMAGPARDVTAVGFGKSALDQFLDAALKADGRSVTPDPKPEAGYYYRSDHFALAKLGVPMLYIDGGQDLIDGGRAAGEAVAKDYTDNRYHGPKDEFNEGWDWSGVMADLQLYYRLGRMLATSTSWPNWNEGDEFKGVRDEACAASDKGC